MNSLDIDKIKGYLNDKHKRREQNKEIQRSSSLSSSGLKFGKFNLSRNKSMNKPNNKSINKSINKSTNKSTNEYNNNFLVKNENIKINKILQSHIDSIKYTDYLISDEYVNIIENLVKYDYNLLDILKSNIINIVDKNEIKINKELENIKKDITLNNINIQNFLNINNILEKFNDELYYEMIKHTIDKEFYLSLKINIIIANYYIWNILPILKKRMSNISNSTEFVESIESIESNELLKKYEYSKDLLSYLTYEKLIQNLLLFNRNNNFDYSDESINTNFKSDLYNLERKYIYNTLVYNLALFSILDEHALKRSQFLNVIENTFNDNLPNLISNTNNILLIYITLLSKFNNSFNNNIKDLNNYKKLKTLKSSNSNNFNFNDSNNSYNCNNTIIEL